MSTSRSETTDRSARDRADFTVAGPPVTGQISEVLDRYLPLLTEDAVIELRGMPPELPTRLTGHDEVRRAVARLTDHDIDITHLAAAEPLLDADTWLVFARGELITRSTGERRRQGYAFAVRFRGALICQCVCVLDPLAAPAAETARRRGRLAPLGFALRRRRRGQAPTDRL
ncbi:nuclear transport factor 2 family protein [Nocardia sp. NPDC051570]|uniref:nuclear transport factor 2 family protein n=1 Tax=Nocardia sp. NPDC051570 TaxID=3364324 RepID=UPI0037AFC840